jgi:TonB family protein
LIKRFFLLISCVLIFFGSIYAQNVSVADTTIHYAFNKKPVFPGGDQARIAFLARHIHYPQDALDHAISGNVYTSFIVEPDGSISHIKILRGLGYGCDAEAKRVLSLMTKWNPGLVKGKPVRSYVTQVISFQMKDNEKAYTHVDQLPVFAVGKAGIEHYLTNHLWYPAQMVKRQEVDTVLVGFEVGPYGLISHLRLIPPKAKKDAYDYEALRVVPLLPVLHPAMLHGKPVAVKLYVPVVFDHQNIRLRGGMYKTVKYDAVKFRYFIPKGHLPEMYKVEKKDRLLQFPGRNEKTDTTGPIFSVVDKMPQFPGGLTYLMRYLKENIKYPVDARATGCNGRVILHFVVEPDGSISNVQVLKSVCPSLDNEAVRVVEKMPKWIPGSLKGKPVRVGFILPVRFSFD